MTHISRPFQIALAVMVLFVAVWLVALRGHSSGTESSASKGSANVAAATPQQASGSSASPGSAGSGSSSSPSSTYNGAAPGVAGLTRAIAKARGAVAQQQKSDQASTSPSAQPAQTSSAGTSHNGSAAKSQPSAAASPAATASAKAAPNGGAKAKSGVSAMQLKVESQLRQGKVVAILFWNPKGAADRVVHRELQVAGRKLGGELAVHVARSAQVGSFGTFTRTVQVYGTPTILMINTKGATSSLPGLKDAFSIEQAVKEVKLAR